MNMSLGQKKINRKCLTKYDILQHVTESSERVIFITNVCSVCKGFLRKEKKKRGDHYSPNEICSMIYETHLSCEVQPLSRAVYLKKDAGFSERNQLHIIPQPKMHMFQSKTCQFWQAHRETEPASSKVRPTCSSSFRDAAKRGPAAPQAAEVLPEPLQRASADAAAGAGLALGCCRAGAVRARLRVVTLPAASPRRRTFPTWPDPTQQQLQGPGEPGEGSGVRQIGVVTGRDLAFAPDSPQPAGPPPRRRRVGSASRGSHGAARCAAHTLAWGRAAALLGPHEPRSQPWLFCLLAA